MADHESGNKERVLLGHGSGGRMMRELLDRVVFRALGLEPDDADAAVLEPGPGRLAFTTDSFVVTPLFFPGGDIGSLAVAGTVNDLAVVGAEPRFLSLALIIEEGLELGVLESVLDSMRRTAAEAGVRIVTGDTKVVARGQADGLFINTAGLGVVRAGIELGPKRIEPGDAVLVSGNLGDHGLAVMLEREGLGFGHDIRSDAAPLNGLATALVRKLGPGLRFMRDPTRGGLAAALNELAAGSGLGIELEESRLPFSRQTLAACELLGLDPLESANEGKLAVVVGAAEAEPALEVMRGHRLGRDAAVIGRVTAEFGPRVALRTLAGGRRVVPMPLGDQLPRIC